MALVCAGAVSVLRMAFASRVKWVEAFAFIGIFGWRYWAHSIGLFPWHAKSSKSNGFRFPSLPQAVLNGLALFLSYLVLLNSLGDPRTAFTWIAARAAPSLWPPFPQIALIPAEAGAVPFGLEGWYGGGVLGGGVVPDSLLTSAALC